MNNHDFARAFLSFAMLMSEALEQERIKLNERTANAEIVRKLAHRELSRTFPKEEKPRKRKRK